MGITVTLDVLKSSLLLHNIPRNIRYNSNIRCIEMRLYEKDARGGTSITVTLDVLKFGNIILIVLVVIRITVTLDVLK